jgi:hypothetical protein
MGMKFNLRSEFETEGVFWFPEKSEERFSGHLSAKVQGIELSEAATLANPERLFQNSTPQHVPDALHGWTTLGICSLLDLHELNGPQQVDTKTGQILSIRRFRIGLCIIGIHLSHPAELLSGSMECTCSGLDDWLRPTSLISVTEDAVSVRYPRKSHRLLDFCVLAGKIRITLSVGSDLELSSSGHHSAAHRPRIAIEPAEATSLQELLDTAYRFEDFLTLLLGVSTRLLTIKLIIAGGSEGWIVRRERGNFEEFDLQESFQCEPSELSAAIALWFSVAPESRPLQSFVYGTMRDNSVNIETEFLFLAQALESFHRLTDTSTLVDASIFWRDICCNHTDNSGCLYPL